MKDAFDSYIQSFDLNHFELKRKQYHTYRVAELSKFLAQSLDWKEEDIALAEQIGWLHDIGRFEQIVQINTYNDRKWNHAERGADLLFQENLISKFPVNKENYEIVEKAIRNHNRYEIEDGLDERCLAFCKLIRDADKLDILKLMIEGKITMEIDGKFPERALDDLKQHRQVRIQGAYSKSEHVLIMIGFIYDLNYQPSITHLLESGILEEIKEQLQNEVVDKEVKRAKVYLKTRREQHVR